MNFFSRRTLRPAGIFQNGAPGIRGGPHQLGRRRAILLGAIVVAGLWLGSPSAPAAELKIVAAENFYGGVAQLIAGSGATVTSILTNPNQDPHEFTSNAETARSVADADIVIYSGISYDPWMEKLLGTGEKPNRVVINVANLIGAKEGDNPHIWYDPRTMPALGAKLVEVLSKIDPGYASAGKKRLEDFNASMKPELDRIAKIKAASSGLEVTATEPVFGYMADALGFKMLNYDFQVKIMNDAEPTAEETIAFETSLTSRRAKILFYNSQVTDPTTDRIQQIARQAGAPVVGVTETQPPDEKSYVGWMMHELDGVQAALAITSKSP
jgi:zinc/manganese transport system substrate-binding protein